MASSAGVLASGISVNLSSDCHLRIDIQGTWVNVIQPTMKNLFIDRFGVFSSSSSSNSHLFSMITPHMLEPWTTELLPRLHTVTKLFGGRVVTHSAFSSQGACANIARAVHITRVIKTWLEQEQGSGPACMKRLLEHCLGVWDTHSGSAQSARFGTNQERVCAGVIERFDPESDHCPTVRFKVSRMTLSCEPGWSLFGWGLTQPTIALAVESAILSVPRLDSSSAPEIK